MPSFVTGTLKASIGTTQQFTIAGRINATYGVTQTTYTVDQMTGTTGMLPGLGQKRSYRGTATTPVKTEILGRPASGQTGACLEVECVKPIAQQPGPTYYRLTLR